MRPFHCRFFGLTCGVNEPDHSGALDLLSTCSSLGDFPDLPAEAAVCEASEEDEPIEMHSSPVYLRKVGWRRKSLVGVTCRLGHRTCTSATAGQSAVGCSCAQDLSTSTRILMLLLLADRNL